MPETTTDGATAVLDTPTRPGIDPQKIVGYQLVGINGYGQPVAMFPGATLAGWNADGTTELANTRGRGRTQLFRLPAGMAAPDLPPQSIYNGAADGAVNGTGSHATATKAPTGRRRPTSRAGA